jgi:uncharacterized protein (TIGR00375 family)
MQACYADLHIHIGRSSSGRPVKITASRDLTFEGICRECVERKGIQIAGVIDCASPPVIEDIEALIAAGEMVPLPGGGLRYLERLTVIPGAEFEVRERAGGISHVLSYYPTVEQLRAFSAEMGRHVSNLELSSQQCRMPAEELARIAIGCGGIVVPAHAFTPHKSLYGACAASIHQVFSDDTLESIPAIELGLSADTYLADRLPELAELSFLSNSDAHSLPKIGREYNVLLLREESYADVLRALYRREGRCVAGNYGMDPRLGKYHRTFCEECNEVVPVEPPARTCSRCGGGKVTFGVLDRIVEIAPLAEPDHPEHRPPYQHQVPLQFVPKVGAVVMAKLLNRFGSEMAVLHTAEEDDLAETVGTAIARSIIAARTGSLMLQPGGGGRFGKVVSRASDAQLRLGINP